MSEKETLVGAHMSIAGGVFNSIERAKDLNANTLQIFTANQRQWNGKAISKEDAKLFDEARKRDKIKAVVSHSNYLINLGSPDEEGLKKSRKAFAEELDRCHLLKIDYLVFHPGSALKSSVEECLDTIVESLLHLSPIIKKGKTRLLLETTAGQGSNVGYKFEHLSYIIKKVQGKIPIGICLDTCHIFVAGYDIRDKQSFDKTFTKFSKVIGMNHLYAFHINDSLTDLGSKRDRHESLGKGKIGIDCFKFLMRDKRFEKMPKILETKDVNLWREEIELLKKFAR